MKRTYQINVIITSQEDETVEDDWVFDVIVDDLIVHRSEDPETGKSVTNRITPNQLVTLAKCGAMRALLEVGLYAHNDSQE